LIFKKIKFIYLKQNKRNLFHSTIIKKKDSKANGSFNLQIILTWRWVDNLEPEGEASRINPAETCACACKNLLMFCQQNSNME